MSSTKNKQTFQNKTKQIDPHQQNQCKKEADVTVLQYYSPANKLIADLFYANKTNSL